MSPYLIIALIVAYFFLLMFISFATSKNADNQTFFIGNKKSPWYIVAFGMIGASISGVTFISVPGWVGSIQFSYMQLVFGYLIGYLVIGTVLMPLYYRLNLISIYTYLDQRFGFFSYKTGSFFFLLSRTIGSAFRLYLAANVLQITIFDKWHVPFLVTVIVTILFIWLYTYKGGIKTIIWTDTLLTLFMLIALGATIFLISKEMNFGFADLFSTIKESKYSRIFFFDDFNDKRHFIKQFLSGVFIAIVMTGLDQDLMQKNLSCKNIKEAQKNMFWFSIVFVFVNFLFLALGALLYIFANSKGIAIPAKTDDLYPIIATQGYLNPFVGIFFIIGLIATACSSTDSALTALTTSFSIDFLNVNNKEETVRIRIRKRAHIFISFLILIVIMLFRLVSNDSVISELFTVAGYTYGPLLGLYSFGLLTKYPVKDKYVPIIAIVSPAICYTLNKYSEVLFNGYQFSFELLILNGLLTFVGLFIIRKQINTN